MSTTCPAHPTETDAPDTAPTGVTRLPLALVPHSGGRSAMTCRYRCGDACSRQDGNDTDNEYFGDIVTSALSRRSFLQVGAGTAGAVSLGVWGATAPAAAAPAAAPADLAAAEAAAAPAASAGSSAFGRLFPAGFAGISPIPATTDAVVVPKGWAWKPLISWGDPLFDDAPGFSFGKQSAAAQAKQFGYNNDYTTLIRRSTREALLVCNHEYTNDELMFAGVKEAKDLSDEQLRIIMAAHGMSVVDVTRRGTGSPWRYVRGGAHNRRIHTHTPFSVTGPAAGHTLLKTKADPTGRRVLGTLNYCAGGTTPWGTVLSGEENVDQYFNAKNAPKDRLETLLRYTTDTEGRGWERVDSRFDVGVEPNEVHRFGWVVEVDPSDPRSTPPSRVLDPALFGVEHIYHQGRFGHDPEGAVALLGALVAVCGGASIGHVLRTSGLRGWRRIAVGLTVLATFVATALWTAQFIAPMKRLWTPPFSLGVAAACGLVLLVLHLLLDSARDSAPDSALDSAPAGSGVARRVRDVASYPLVALGRNSLLVYFGSHVLMLALLTWPRGAPGSSNAGSSYAHRLAATAPSSVEPALWLVLVAVTAWTGLACLLHWRRLYLRP